MTSLSGLQTGYVDYNLHRVSADTRPWTAAEVQAHCQTAMDGLWRDQLGLRTSGDVTTDPTTMTYTLPTGMLRIRRIDLVDSDGIYRDRIANFRVLMDDDTPASFIVEPLLATGYTMKVLGYKKFDRSGSDLPTELESVVAAKATSLCWGSLAGELLNTKRQQNTDPGRGVSYSDALASRDYWMGVYREGIENTPYRIRIEQVAVSR